MHIHILGICGTFMAGIAHIALTKGHQVTGSDEHIYPPMSTQLADTGIKLTLGYENTDSLSQADLVIMGNAMKRGHPAVEYVLREQLPYISGPQWLYEEVLRHKTVLAVAGTHGKTTTSSMLNWILTHAKLNPSFLIGGVPGNFTVSAKLTDSPYFVIEADEYDSAFFDKRSKFLHYHPKIAILNNCEFDHADIFNNIADIQRQFHFLMRTIPDNGTIIRPYHDVNLDAAQKMGCWTPITTVGAPKADWSFELHADDASCFEVLYQGKSQGKVEWSVWGLHNAHNALAAIAAAKAVGVEPAIAIAALSAFQTSTRRMELKGTVHNVSIYDDFAHHPTAIETTLGGFRARIGKTPRIIAVLELRSYTMRTGHHQDTLASALKDANAAHVLKPLESTWDVNKLIEQALIPTTLYSEVDDIVKNIIKEAKPGDHIVVMSNGGFDNIHQKLLNAL